MNVKTLNSVPYEDIHEVTFSSLQRGEIYVLVQDNDTGRKAEIHQPAYNEKGEQLFTLTLKEFRRWDVSFYRLSDVAEYISCELPDGATTFTEAHCAECQEWIERDEGIEYEGGFCCGECDYNATLKKEHNDHVRGLQFGSL